MTQWNLGPFEINLTKLQKSAPNNAAALRTAHQAVQEKFRSGGIGFFDFPDQVTSAEVAQMSTLATTLQREFQGAVVIGIGGSYLGAATLVQALQSPEQAERFPLHWLVNVDGPAIGAVKHFISKHKSAAVIVSKSGNTTETLSGLVHLSAALDPKGFVAITDPASGELRRLATQEKWHHFPVPPTVGGRFSALTAVGLFPALLAGLSANEILEGARQMRKLLLETKPDENPAALFAQLLWHWDTALHHSAQYLMPYSSALEKLSAWYVQLWGESLGKKLRGNPSTSVGPTPGAALGTSDQHSLLQLFKEGPNNKVIGFVDVAPSKDCPTVGKPRFEMRGQEHLYHHTFDHITRAASFATETSLTNSGVPTYRLSLQKVDARTLGALLFFFETACAYAGEFYAVDAFNQPGVEESKKLLKAALSG